MRIISTPASDTPTPQSCSGLRRSRRKIHESVITITGMNEFRISAFVAVV